MPAPRRLLILLITAATVLYTLSAGLACHDGRGETAQPVADVPIKDVPDGAHEGAFQKGNFTYRVRTHVKDHRIVKVEVLANRDSDYARQAEKVLARVVTEQKCDVDATTGATATSQALLKAVENSLDKARQ